MPTIKILFIGNSHTYYNHMPRMLEKLAAFGFPQIPILTKQSTGPGVNLEWHWRHPKTRDLISRGGWNYVVLQDRSGGPLEEKDTMHKYTGFLHDEIKKQSAKTLLYLTWANRARPETQKSITQVYTQIAHELGAGVAPVGVAWKIAAIRNPDIHLYAPDGRHASSAGSYLSACVFYELIYDVGSVGLPGKLRISDKIGVDLTRDQAVGLQQAVSIALNRFRNF